MSRFFGSKRGKLAFNQRQNASKEPRKETYTLLSPSTSVTDSDIHQSTSERMRRPVVLSTGSLDSGVSISSYSSASKLSQHDSGCAVERQKKNSDSETTRDQKSEIRKKLGSDEYRAHSEQICRQTIPEEDTVAISSQKYHSSYQLAEFSDQESGLSSIEEELRSRVKQNLPKFIELTNWKFLLPHLVSVDLSDHATTDYLLNENRTHQDKGVHFYLRVLPSNRPDAYTRFHRCLCNEMEHLGHQSLLQLLQIFDSPMYWKQVPESSPIDTPEQQRKHPDSKMTIPEISFQSGDKAEAQEDHSNNQQAELREKFADEQGNSVVSSIGYLRGAEVVGEIDLLIKNEATTFLWEGHGFKLNVPKNSLPEDVSEYPVNIKASLTGQFELPEGLELVSAVYWVYVPGQFMKPVTIEIQHCANFSSPSQLHFVRTSCTQKSLPYKFEVVDGGSFTLGSKYGALSTTRFSGNGIAKEVAPGEHSCQYCAQVYFTVKHLKDYWYYCHFVVTKDMEACLTAVKRKYPQEYDIATSITFGGDHIALDIPEDGVMADNRWQIVPVHKARIKKDQVDGFLSEKISVPECVLLLKWQQKDKAPDPLDYKVKLLGAAEEDFFRIVHNPENFLWEQSSRSGSLLSGMHRSWSETSDEHSQITTSPPTVISADIAILDEKPRLAQLTILKTTKGRVQIIDSIAHRWKKLGILMDFDDDGNKVDLIENEHKQDGPVACCQEVFKLWLKGTHATWRNLIDLLNDCEMGELIQEIKNALGLPSV